MEGISGCKTTYILHYMLLGCPTANSLEKTRIPENRAFCSGIRS